MTTTLTTFQRNFSKARAAADRGETVMIHAAGAEYMFHKRPKKGNPFADLSHLCGIISLPPSSDKSRERIRRHLRKDSAH
jgi:hypothetical protein